MQHPILQMSVRQLQLTPDPQPSLCMPATALPVPSCARALSPCACRPKLDMRGEALVFTYKTVVANETALPELGGTVNTLVASPSNMVAPTVAPATTFYNASLVIDISGINAYVAPSTGEKAGLIRIPLSKHPAHAVMCLQAASFHETAISTAISCQCVSGGSACMDAERVVQRSYPRCACRSRLWLLWLLGLRLRRSGRSTV